MKVNQYALLCAAALASTSLCLADASKVDRRTVRRNLKKNSKDSKSKKESKPAQPKLNTTNHAEKEPVETVVYISDAEPIEICREQYPPPDECMGRNPSAAEGALAREEDNAGAAETGSRGSGAGPGTAIPLIISWTALIRPAPKLAVLEAVVTLVLTGLDSISGLIFHQSII